MRGKQCGRNLLRCNPVDHPRGCGENFCNRLILLKGKGSPPRMRGKQYINDLYDLCDGITPADAGKTQGKIFPPRDMKDHPRGCGENRYRQGTPPKASGSPPRMRGKLPIMIAHVPTSGITPADAGKTVYLKRAYRNKEDHPRGCGEN